MNIKNILGAFLVAIVTCLALPAIATPPDSPPKAHAAFDHPDTSIQFAPLFGEYAVPIERAITLNAPLYSVPNYNAAILGKNLTATKRSLEVYRRSSSEHPFSSQGRSEIRAMNTAPPGCS